MRHGNFPINFVAVCDSDMIDDDYWEALYALAGIEIYSPDAQEEFVIVRYNGFIEDIHHEYELVKLRGLISDESYGTKGGMLVLDSDTDEVVESFGDPAMYGIKLKVEVAIEIELE